MGNKEFWIKTTSWGESVVNFCYVWWPITGQPTLLKCYYWVWRLLHQPFFLMENLTSFSTRGKCLYFVCVWVCSILYTQPPKGRIHRSATAQLSQSEVLSRAWECPKWHLIPFIVEIVNDTFTLFFITDKALVNKKINKILIRNISYNRCIRWIKSECFLKPPNLEVHS